MQYLLIIILTTASGTQRTEHLHPTFESCDAAQVQAQADARKLPGPWVIKTRCEVKQ